MTSVTNQFAGGCWLSEQLGYGAFFCYSCMAVTAVVAACCCNNSLPTASCGTSSAWLCTRAVLLVHGSGRDFWMQYVVRS